MLFEAISLANTNYAAQDDLITAITRGLESADQRANDLSLKIIEQIEVMKDRDRNDREFAKQILEGQIST